jgi:hypothetical protein
MKRILAALATLSLLSACMPPITPDPSPDGGPPAPPNGRIENPDRPDGVAPDALFFSWHIITLNDDWEEIHAPAKVFVEAVSNAPVQGNVHGPYPFQIYTYTPYTHTIWWQPGLEITSRVTATLDPVQPGVSVICLGSSHGSIDEQIQEIPPTHDQAYCSATWESAQ